MSDTERDDAMLEELEDLRGKVTDLEADREILLGYVDHIRGLAYDTWRACQEPGL